MERKKSKATPLTAKEWTDLIIAAVGKKIGDTDSRLMFAKNVMRDLPAVVAMGRRNAVQKAPTEEDSLDAAVRATVNAFNILKVRAQRNPLEATIESKCRHKAQASVGNRIDKCRPGTMAKVGRVIDLHAAIDEYLACLQSELEKNAAPAKKRGPNNIAAVFVAKMVAKLYKDCFGRPPKSVTGDTLTPFDRVCAVLDKLFREINANIKITETTRKKVVGLIR
ncbi:MAG: hypothetical protein ACYC9L_16300 [Sulfuricaulis sp.]